MTMVGVDHGQMTMVEIYHGQSTMVEIDHGQMTMVIFFDRSWLVLTEANTNINTKNVELNTQQKLVDTRF